MRRKRIIILFLGIFFFSLCIFLCPQRYQGHVTVYSLDGEVLELELDVVLHKKRLHIGTPGGTNAGDRITFTDKLYGTIMMDGQTYWSQWNLWDERNMSRNGPASSYMFFTGTDSLFNDPACTYIIMYMEPGFQHMSFWVIRKNGEDTMYYESACGTPSSA